jgi:hypothetical protein
MNTRIIYTNTTGGVSIIVPAGSIEDCMKDIPEGAAYEIVTTADIPSDRTFRDAWEKQGKVVSTNLTKAKGIAHDKRRLKRSEEFAPLDVEVTIPSKAPEAEAKRQKVRDKYTLVQNEIDNASDVSVLKALVDSFL